jgi:MSHA biogenesis protein MshL
LKTFVHDAMSQVDIEASIVDVALNDQFSLGVDWSKILSAKGLLGAGGAVALAGGTGGVAAPALTATFTNSSVSAVVTALRQLTDAKVISNPHIIAINNTPATFFDGTELPYLGSVVATPSSTGINTTTQLSGSASFATNGVAFSVQPSIVDDKHVQITLVPVLSTVLSFQTFQLGSGGTLTAPQQATKQSFMKVMAESGKTLILGGIRYSTDSKTDSPAPLILGNLARSRSAQEIVILMRATVLPAADYDPLVGESP